MDRSALERLEDRKSHLRRILTTVLLAVVVLLGGTAVWLRQGVLTGAETEPVLVGGQARFVKGCAYLTLLGKITKQVGEPQADSAAVAGTPCPKHIAD